ncbi:MAG: hypothetical protein KatS3mg108_3343 [Isosphaeraceae bacterium]|nr:MAG: hypothetical protein KatS3mg108_3343 [Isosphaeraceae bacterium]
MSRLELADLQLRRGGLTWFDLGRSNPLTIESGELFGVAGPSGSGKTTLARLIVGLDTPDEGQIRLGGRLLDSTPPARRGVALVWDDDEPWPDRSVYDNIDWALRCRGVPARARRLRIPEILTVLGLDGLDRLPAGSLTPVQRWAVCLGRALCLEPELLIVDEPFDRLTDRDRDQARQLLRHAHDELRVTSLVLSRRLPQIIAISDRLAVLCAGRVAQVGTPFEVYSRPATLEVAQQLSTGNLLPGQVESVDPRGTVVVRTAVGRLLGRSRIGLLAVGDAAVVFIRPEVFTVGPTAALSSNRFSVVLRRRVFFGSYCRLEWEAPGAASGTTIVLPPVGLSLREGQSLTLCVPSEWVVVFSA